MLHFYDVTVRFWDELISRPSGPLAFRFILQPVTAGLLALRDGMKDARHGRSPYLWTILHDPARRNARLHEGFVAVVRVLMLGVAMEAIYQFIEIHAFRPIEMIDIVVLLAFVPYLILRGPFARIARFFMQRNAARHESQPLHHG